MRIDVISALPEIFKSPLHHSIIGRAAEKNIVTVEVHDLRNYATGKYRQVDDTPFGGGGGMVLKPEPFFKCIEKLKSERDYDQIIFVTPQGKKLTQKMLNKLSLNKSLMILCGHYKGIDQRVIDKYVTMEISIGDYVLTGGELPALVIIDSLIRLLPGAIGNSESALSDSFQALSVFDAPQYTRPAEYQEMKVPEILLSGDHKKIYDWRHEKGTTNYKRVRKIKKHRIRK